MVLTVQHCLGHIEHALLGRAAEELYGRGLINEAGESMVAYHPWKWLDRGDTQLTLRGKTAVPLTSTYTHGTFTIASPTGTFTNYSFVAGDRLTITDAGSLTGVNRNERYSIASTDNDTDLVLTSPGFGAAQAGITDWAGEIRVPYALLPTDFMELIAYDATNSLINSLELTSFQHLLELRTNQLEIAAWNFYGALSWYEDETDSDRVKPRLELWPDPPSGTSETLSIFYKTSWPRIDMSDEEVKIPQWMEPCFIDWLRAYVRGYEDDADDQKTKSVRLAEVVQGPVWMGAVERDGRLQPDYGPMRGGAVQSMPFGYNRFLRTTVAGPS